MNPPVPLPPSPVARPLPTNRPSSNRQHLRRLWPAAAALVAAMGLSGCYYPYGPYGYGYPGYGYAAPVAAGPVVAAPVVVGGGGYYGYRYRGW